MKSASIVVITYNEEKNIRDCLDSVLKLDFPNKEIIVVDASDDKTAEIVKKYKNVKLIKSEKGFAHQRNIGVKEAKHDWIAFIDADCIVPKDWLKKLMIHSNEDIGGVSGNVFPPEKSPKLGLLISCLGFPAGGAIGLDSNFKGELKDVPAVGLFSKKAIEQAGYFREDLKYGGEDSELSRKIYNGGYKFIYEPNAVMYHKTRNSLKSFFKWCFTRGIAKYGLKKNPLDLLMPFSIFIFPFSKKYYLLAERRERIGVNLLEILTWVNLLFLSRQIFMMGGWIYGFTKSFTK